MTSQNALFLRGISREEHAAFLTKCEQTVSFLQTPEWADVKREWRHESIGWFAGDELVGVGLVLFRDAPLVKKSLAYLPEGPVINWVADSVAQYLKPLVQYLKQRGAFQVKIGVPVVARVWYNETIKNAIGTAVKLGKVEPDVSSRDALKLRAKLEELGWSQETAEEGFGDVQPRYVFTVDMKNRTDVELLNSFNQLWRRNLKKAEKSGVVVRTGRRADLPKFHEVYVETAARDGFRPRPLSYFERYWDAFTDSNDELRLYLAEIDGEVAAATIWVRVNKYVWYSYGASTTRHRDARPSNAIQWQMMRDARDAGAHTYDLRGISDVLDESHHLFGLIRFKLGIGGQAVEYLGEHDYAINKPLALLFKLAMKRR